MCLVHSLKKTQTLLDNWEIWNGQAPTKMPMHLLLNGSICGYFLVNKSNIDIYPNRAYCRDDEL